MTQKRALLVGVNSYKDVRIKNLNYAIGDASRLFGLLANLPDFDAVLLPDPSAEEVIARMEKMVFGQEATAGEKEVLPLSEGDLFFFYFAGHGFQPPGKDQHLLLCKNALHDVLQGHGTNGSVPHTFLKEKAQQSLADMIFCFDACRSSVLRDRRGAAPMAGSAFLRDIGVGQNKRGACMTILSCSDGESAEEREDLEAGIFTYSLCEQMRDRLKKNRSIIFDTEMMASVAKCVEQYGEQTPTFTLPAGRQFVLFHGTSDAKTGGGEIPLPRVELPEPAPVKEQPEVDTETLLTEVRKRAEEEAAKIIAAAKRQAEAITKVPSPPPPPPRRLNQRRATAWS